MDEAIALFEALNRKSDLTDCYTMLGEIYQQIGDNATANIQYLKMREIMQASLLERGFVLSS